VEWLNWGKRERRKSQPEKEHENSGKEITAARIVWILREMAAQAVELPA
jgi:hypothetical protein